PIVVYPGREATIDALLALRPRLGGGVVLPYPHPDAVRALRDKRGLAELASGCGLPTPATLFEGPAAELATAGIELPAIVKPSAAVSALPTARTVASRRERAALLLDVNPRFYACMPLALRCGVNLPATWHAVVEGRVPGPPTAYPAGRRFRWLEGDLYAARHGHPMALLRGGRAQTGAMW